MAHFTYDQKNDSSLHQGDIIRRSTEVNEILKAVHPHYHDSKDYKHFIVLTQSCDLARRDGKPPKSRYISIAAVRPLRLAIEREAESYLHSDVEEKLGILDDTKKEKLRQFVERLLNNNESDYFFLYREPHFGFVEDQCAFLKLSIALKSELHYEALLNAKILQLKESFQHKLGYLVGNSYSRIGTEDWLPKNIDKKLWNQKLKDAIDQIPYNFLPKEDFKYIVEKAKKVPGKELDYDLLGELLEEKKKEKSQKRRDFADLVGEILNGVGVDEALVKKAKSRLINEPRLKAYLK